MQRKRRMNVVSVWIIVVFTVIAITLIALFLMVYHSILRSEVRTALREQVEVLRDNADSQVVDVIQNQVARTLASKDLHTGYIADIAAGEIPGTEQIRALTAYFHEVKAGIPSCQRVELYFPASEIIVGSHGVQFLSDRKYTVANNAIDYVRGLYPADDLWLKRTVLVTGSEETHLLYARLYPGVYPQGQTPMLVVSLEQYSFLDQLRASMRTLDSEDQLMLITPDGIIWSAEADRTTAQTALPPLGGTLLPEGDLSKQPHTLSNGQEGLIVEAASMSGAWSYALLHPASSQADGYGMLVSVWAILCVAMLFIGLLTVLLIMMKHYTVPMRRLMSNLPSGAHKESGKTLSSPGEHFLQLESALSDMNKLRLEREHFMTHNQPVLRETWLNCFVQGEAYYTVPHPQLGIEFPYPHFQVVIASCKPNEEELQCIQNVLKGKNCLMEQFESREKETVLLFNHALGEHELSQALEEAAEQLDKLQSELVIGVGIFCPDDELVAASFRCARRSFASRYFERDRRVCVFDPDVRYTEPENLLSDVIAQLTELTVVIQQNSQAKVERTIDSIVNQLKETMPYMNTMRSIMLLTAMRLAKVVYDMKGAPEEVYGDNLLNAYYHIGGISEFSQRLKHDCELLRQYLSRETSPANRSVVQYAIHHIRNSAPAELSTHSIAEAIGISTGHLSRMFHQETGRKLVDYLQEIRMEYAAKLIAEGSLSNEEICAKIGYSRLQYFAGKFKEHYGLTLNEYRRKAQQDTGNSAENREDTFR